MMKKLIALLDRIREDEIEFYKSLTMEQRINLDMLRVKNIELF